ncbi:MAG TPA: flagellar hook-associated protein FlgK [Candidatus Accumulibacter phosphatis]|nr:MAG: Flagellar hook-associated protein 1 [Candidatus Accumulibacter sp. SK-11]HAY29604.1 flagellar hook-associated protein FlgK [Accumulibacter sp.]HRL74832.1 flagellar hook-associated protein FlgK [Candidatus Accumulibacter phosphatis]HCN68635.1 flagellar hook-associated protein FlgK [Accumulibacter sp.]HCV12345.1 flagellar hook-associated protein FlgK [Accumulibacter sp.]
MGSGILGAGVSGLLAAQHGLQTTEHNIANASTPGYTRQRVIQGSNAGVMTGSGFLGQGTHVATIERVYSRFLTEQVDRSQSGASQLDTYAAQIKQIDNLLADSNAGLSPALQAFFDGVAQVAANPSHLPSRQTMISSAQGLSARYQSLGTQLAQMYDGINGELRDSVKAINSYAEQIARLNEQIGVAQAATGHSANDLLDTRDFLVAELNQLIRAKTSANGDGSINVFVGNGQQLVVGSQSIGLAITVSASDPSRLVVGLKSGAGVQEMPESLIDGGALGGLLAFRSESLDRVSSDLGRSAVSLAQTLNAQSALGQDLLGQSLLSPPPSGFTPALFTVGEPGVRADNRNPAGSPTVSAAFTTPLPFSGNFYTDLAASDYRLTSDGASVTLTRLADKRQWTAADMAALDVQLQSEPQGFSVAASGQLPAGASYLIQPTRDAARKIALNPALVADPRLIPAAAPIRTAAGTANTGAARISPGSVGPGYEALGTALPLTVVYDNGQLRNFPAGTRVSIDGGAPQVIASTASGVAYTSGASITLVGAGNTTPPSGVSFSISGLPNNGDSFVLARNTGATADGRNVLALAQLQTLDTMSGRTASFQESYAQLVSENGNRTRQAQIGGEAQKALLKQARESRDSLSGVNLDEEAANLIRYQQAYQASAKALQIATSLFDTILNIAAR